MVQKNGLYDDGLLGFRWRFPHQSADWFGMTVLFDAQSFLHKFQFIRRLSKTDKHNSNLSGSSVRQEILGNTAQLRQRISADLLHHFCSFKNGKYIQYSPVFETLNWHKISR